MADMESTSPVVLDVDAESPMASPDDGLEESPDADGLSEIEPASAGESVIGPLNDTDESPSTVPEFTLKPNNCGMLVIGATTLTRYMGHLASAQDAVASIAL